VIGCAKEKFWERLVAVVDRPELELDDRFSSFEARAEHAAEVVKILDEALLTRPTEYWIEHLQAAGVPCAPILDVPAALAQPLVRERGLLIETEHPRFGTVVQLGSPVKVGEPRLDHRRAPQRNEDADYLLKRLGYDEARITQLTESGAFG
jgi:crotonobetainyl-CoA:carnitine CoA-transferase CaiB-like acyl-CoA transferase